MRHLRNSAARVVSLATAIVLAASTVLFCAPTPSAAEAPGHCRPTGTERTCSHCPVQDVLDCCENPEQPPASAPAQGPAARVSLDQAQAPADAAVVSLGVPGAASLLRHAPPHGYRTIDLPTLNATLLI